MIGSAMSGGRLGNWAMESQFRAIAQRNMPRQSAAPSPVAAPTAGGGGGAGGATAVSGGSNVMDLYTKALERLSTGGASLEANLADIEAGKQSAIARGQQSMVSGGLGGTSVMAGVPLAAEKGASIQRLRARGESESKYLTTLASYASFAQRAQESAAERAAAMQRLQMQLSSQEQIASMPRGGSVPSPQTGYVTGGGLSPSIPRTMVSGIGPTTNYAQQFPSIYGGEEEGVPNWTT